MQNEKPNARAEMPKGTNQVLDRRTVQNANKNLLDWVKPGMKVLDVGCGSGTITRGIVDLVGDKGRVVGIDPSEHLIAQAQSHFPDIPNLQFVQADLFNYKKPFDFDLVTSARVLQWLDRPQEGIEKMVSLLSTGGIVSILDYNHEKIVFEPGIPESMTSFYTLFLKWRSDAGFDNQIADHLEDMLSSAGLENIETKDFHEISIRGNEGFKEEVGIWKAVAELRGKQLVKDGYVTEEERLKAISDYEQWIHREAQKMVLYIRSVTGIKPNHI